MRVILCRLKYEAIKRFWGRDELIQHCHWLETQLKELKGQITSLRREKNFLAKRAADLSKKCNVLTTVGNGGGP